MDFGLVQQGSHGTVQYEGGPSESLLTILFIVYVHKLMVQLVQYLVLPPKRNHSPK